MKILDIFKMSALAIGAYASSSEAKTLTIGLDVSGSNPLIIDENFSRGAALFAAEKVAELESGDVVRILTFGDRRAAENLKRIEFKISKRNRAREVARASAQYIAAIPKAVQDGQPETNIVAWLEHTGGFECEENSEIVVITDGVQAAKNFNPQSFIAGRISLPPPRVNLKGCSVTFFGLGAGVESNGIHLMETQWRDFIEVAGATFFAEKR